MEYSLGNMYKKQGGSQKWTQIAKIYYAKTADMGMGGVKKGRIFADVFYLQPLKKLVDWFDTKENAKKK